MAQLFRSHAEAPVGVRSALLRHLVEEWVDLNRSRTAARAIAGWAAAEPVLAGLRTPAMIVDHVDAAEGAATDALLQALLRLCQGGHQLAGRVLLQCLLPGLSAMHRRGGRPGQDPEERTQEMISDFWQVITGYAVDAHPQNVAARLVDRSLRLSARAATTAARRAETLVADTTALTGDTAATLSGRAPDSGPAATLDHVLVWAIERDCVSAADAALIAEVYGEGDGGGYPAAAERRGISQAAARQRCSRAIRRITEALSRVTARPADLVAPDIDELARPATPVAPFSQY